MSKRVRGCENILLLWAASSRPRAYALLRPFGEDLVHHAEVDRFLGGHVEVAVHDLLDLLHFLQSQQESQETAKGTTSETRPETGGKKGKIYIYINNKSETEPKRRGMLRVLSYTTAAV